MLKAINIIRDYKEWLDGDRDRAKPNMAWVSQSIGEVVSYFDNNPTISELTESLRAELDMGIDVMVKRLQWRQDNLDRSIKELKGGY
jgi:hypothetical protein